MNQSPMDVIRALQDEIERLNRESEQKSLLLRHFMKRKIAHPVEFGRIVINMSRGLTVKIGDEVEVEEIRTASNRRRLVIRAAKHLTVARVKSHATLSSEGSADAEDEEI